MGHNSGVITLVLPVSNSNKGPHKSASAPGFEIATRVNNITYTIFGGTHLFMNRILELSPLLLLTDSLVLLLGVFMVLRAMTQMSPLLVLPSLLIVGGREQERGREGQKEK